MSQRFWSYFLLSFLSLSFSYFFITKNQRFSFFKKLASFYKEVRAETKGTKPSSSSTSIGPNPPPLPPPSFNPPVEEPPQANLEGEPRVNEMDEKSRANLGDSQIEENLILPTSEVQFLLKPFIYDVSLDRRDPFVSYEIAEALQAVGALSIKDLPPLRQFSLDQFSLKGVLWDVKKPLAMFEGPGGLTHFVEVQTPIGNRNGYVAAIREGEVLVVEYSLVRGERKHELKRIVLDTDEKKINQWLK